MKVLRAAKKLWKDESGQGMVEYGLILALVAIVAITVLNSLGNEIIAKFQAVVDGFTPTP